MCNHSHHHPNRRAVLTAMPATAAALWLSLGIRPAQADAGPVDLPAPGPRDTCPVCGMFVAKYPEWVATVVFSDGAAVHFDGAKDFFKYLVNLEKYAPGRSADEITGLGVTEYYSISLIDARAAQYVIGSDVYGPMGHELVPLATEADAADFMRDHKGKRLIAFAEVSKDMLTGLDEGRFE